MRYTELIKWAHIKTLFKAGWFRALLLLLATLVAYWFGVQWPFLVSALVLLAIYAPMPKVFNSWLSRLLMSVVMLYALLQVAALIQIYVWPGGKFGFIAAMVAAFIAAIILVFRASAKVAEIKIFTFNDAAVLVGCALFLVPFVSIVRGQDSIRDIARIGGVQIVDAAVHQVSIDAFGRKETLRDAYSPGRYYPSGFHIATGFMQRAVLGDAQNIDWKTSVFVYFGLYLLMGLLLCAILIYTALAFAGIFGLQGKLAAGAIAITVGVSATVLYLWGFISLGFINYYYICASMLASAVYLIEIGKYNARQDWKSQLHGYIWPMAAFLLLAFGAVFSWPLLLPVPLLAGLITVLPLDIKLILGNFWRFIKAHLVIIALLLLYVVTLYIQAAYRLDNADLFTMGGALHNFNIALLFVGVAALLAVMASLKREDVNNKLAAVFVPYVLMIIALMATHFFSVGEARYYLIKLAMILEMLLLVVTMAAALLLLKKISIGNWLRPILSSFAVLFVVLGTIGLLPQPMQEVRSLFREAASVGRPPFYYSDVHGVTDLGLEGKLRDLNMTILHYDQESGRLYSHIQPALWAHSLSPRGSGAEVRGGKGQGCFDRQFNILAYGTNKPGEQEKLKSAVTDCIESFKEKGLPYYVITDDGSVDDIRRIFGDYVTIVNR